MSSPLDEKQYPIRGLNEMQQATSRARDVPGYATLSACPLLQLPNPRVDLLHRSCI